MERDSVRIAREAWRKPPEYRVHGRTVQVSLDMIRWARKPPYALWVVKWPLVAVGLILMWIVGPFLHYL